MVADTTGPTKVYGLQNVATEKGAAAYYNQHGGIGGRPITVTVVDDNGDPSTAVSVLTAWVDAHGKPDLVFPGSTSQDAAALVPAVKRLDLLAIGATDGSAACLTDAQTTCPTFFATITSSKWEGQTMAQWIKSRGVKKVGILFEEDPFSNAELPWIVAALKTDGVPMAIARIPTDVIDVRPELSELKSAGVDALIGGALGPPVAYILRARQQLGLVNSMPLLLDGPSSSVDLTKLASSSALVDAWETVARPAVPSVSIPGRTLMIQYSKSFGVLDEPLYVEEWDDVLLAHDAALQAGSTNMASMIDALNHLDKQYSTDPLLVGEPTAAFTPSSHELQSGSGVTYIVKTGPIQGGMVQSGP
jgi:branched-chain amino acid transport system substrate-binding protein